MSYVGKGYNTLKSSTAVPSVAPPLNDQTKSEPVNLLNLIKYYALDKKVIILDKSINITEIMFS